MAGRVQQQQDTFMDDSDDCCPLCVEEFDLSDRQFKPCPCGYQVCQFCYNNIKSNMNGLCPACRRPYDEKNIVWKQISPEEAKADVAAQARRKAVQRQKEAERRQVETLNRKHLAGLRVLQKNLVYIVGMNITGTNDDVLQTLRGERHFGQYGEIVKILVSKAKEGQNHALGIYVTFVTKEAAAKCISALDGTPHEGRTLRAQYGTTKYCSAYLRNEKCNNRSCMFLHETGDDSDSYSRQDLSSLNALSTQRPNASISKSESSQGAGNDLHYQAPPQQAPQNIAAAALPVASRSDAMSRSDSGDGSALPTTANWAKNPQLEQSRRSSQALNRSTPSPKTMQSRLAIARPESRTAGSGTNSLEGNGKGKEKELEGKFVRSPSDSNAVTLQTIFRPKKSDSIMRLERALKSIAESTYSWSLDRSMYDKETLRQIDNFPQIIDPMGGYKRYVQKERERVKLEAEQSAQAQAPAATDEDENLASGSLQLGGEPDDGDSQPDVVGQGRRQFGQQNNVPNIQAFQGQGSISTDFGGLSLTGRSLTPQQQRNIALMKFNSQNSEAGAQIPRGTSANATQHQPQLSNPFQNQNQTAQINASRHGRQSSRFTFTNDSSSASSTIKPSATSSLMAQQSAMVPQAQKSYSGFTQASLQPSLYTNSYSSIQGPPPGLKSSGTPPISGGGMFSQGHNFASAIGGGASGFAGNNLGMKNASSNDDFVRGLIMRGSGGMNGASEVGKHDLSDPSILQARIHQENYRGTQGQGGYNSHGMMHGGAGRW